MKKISVLIADDHGIVRMGLKSLLEVEDDIAVIGEAADGATAVSGALRLRPDIVIMDLMMPKKDGAAAVQELRRANSRARILLLTTFSTSEGINRALDAGADGAIFKSSADDEIVHAIRQVCSGVRFVSKPVRKLLAAEPPLPEFTQKQLDILTAVVQGLNNREIACRFDIKPITVKSHLKAIFAKLGVTNRTEAASIATRKQLVKA